MPSSVAFSKIVIGRMEIPADEILDGDAPLVDAEVALAEYIGVERQEFPHRYPPGGDIRPEVWMERPVYVLAEEDANAPGIEVSCDRAR